MSPSQTTSAWCASRIAIPISVVLLTACCVSCSRQGSQGHTPLVKRIVQCPDARTTDQVHDTADVLRRRLKAAESDGSVRVVDGECVLHAPAGIVPWLTERGVFEIRLGLKSGEEVFENQRAIETQPRTLIKDGIPALYHLIDHPGVLHADSGYDPPAASITSRPNGRLAVRLRLSADASRRLAQASQEALRATEGSGLSLILLFILDDAVLSSPTIMAELGLGFEPLLTPQLPRGRLEAVSALIESGPLPAGVSLSPLPPGISNGTNGGGSEADRKSVV